MFILSVKLLKIFWTYIYKNVDIVIATYKRIYVKISDLKTKC